MFESTYTVAELGEVLKRSLEVTFPEDVWVVGEISGLNRSRAGHVYFDLLEPADAPGGPTSARIAVALFKTTKDVVNQLLRRAGGIRMTDGMAVRMRGVIDFYAPSGRLQIRMTSIDPTYTLGRLALDRQRLIETLTADGTIGANAALTLPLRPRRIGLVTSENSAAYADFSEQLAASRLRWDIVVCDTRVQGEGAEHSLAAALRAVYRQRVDVIALIRGGGSAGDLQIFDSETLARTIAAAPVPVLTGIGHETDRSIADDVAHIACKTPTAVAAHLIDLARAYETRVDRAEVRLVDATARRLEAASAHVEALRSHGARLAEHSIRAARHECDLHARRIAASIPAVIESALGAIDHRRDELHARARTAIVLARHHTASRDDRLTRRSVGLLAAPRAQLATAQARLRLLDPTRLLARGWTITTLGDGAPIRDASALHPGDRLVTRTSTGTIDSRIESIESEAT